VNSDKTVQDKVVTVSLTQGDTTVITNGLNPGDTVVTDGQDKLQRGSLINVRNATPSSGVSDGRGVSPIHHADLPDLSGSETSGSEKSGSEASGSGTSGS
jgi:hypothetical protein